jgi:hypothetical protein
MPKHLEREREGERERPFQSAGTFSLVTTAPHSEEVVSTTLQKGMQPT